MPTLTAKDFGFEILRQWREAEGGGFTNVVIRAGDLHRGLEDTLGQRIECLSAATL